MKKVKNLSTYLKWNGELVQVVGIAEGKSIIMRPVNATPCEKCGRCAEYYSLEHSPQFQSEAEPIETIIS